MTGDVTWPWVLHKLHRTGRRLVALGMGLRFGPLARSSRPVADPQSSVVVSLTTYGRRLDTVHMTIESIASGSARPARLILWVDTGDQARIGCRLRRLVDRGLEIFETEAHWGPHKKYYPYCVAFAEDDRLLVTADDDVFYQRHWLRDLQARAAAHPEAVVGYRARVMRFERDGNLRPYLDWPLVRGTQASPAYLATGVGGVAYGPSLQRVFRDAGERFLDHHARTDDIWLHLLTVQSGFSVGQVHDGAASNIEILRTQGVGLLRSNQAGRQNDQVLAETYSPAELAVLRAAAAAGNPSTSKPMPAEPSA